jgi:hypothetical protein
MTNVVTNLRTNKFNDEPNDESNVMKLKCKKWKVQWQVTTPGPRHRHWILPRLCSKVHPGTPLALRGCVVVLNPTRDRNTHVRNMNSSILLAKHRLTYRCWRGRRSLLYHPRRRSPWHRLTSWCLWPWHRQRLVSLVQLWGRSGGSLTWKMRWAVSVFFCTNKIQGG